MVLTGKDRYWCQMCRKQCRDHGAFEGHCRSMGHIDAMAKFAAAPEHYMEEFSKELVEGFVEVLREKHAGQRVAANFVYSQYIKDGGGVRLSGTRFGGLGEFAKHLAAAGVCQVEEGTDPSTQQPIYHVALIDTSVAEAAAEKEDARQRDARRRATDEDMRMRAYKRKYELLKQQEAEQQIAALIENDGEPVAAAAPSAQLDDASREKVTVSMASAKKTTGENVLLTQTQGSREDHRHTARREVKLSGIDKTLAALRAETDAKEARQAKRRKVDEPAPAAAPAPKPTTPAAGDAGPWVAEGIVVKLVNKKIADGKYYKAKGTVEKVIDDGYGAKVRLYDADVRLAVDQNDLETVVPKPGGRVRVLVGPQRGRSGVLDRILTDKYAADIEVGGRVERLKYEYFSKMA